MAFKRRRMMLIPDVNPESLVFFFERGTSGMSWSIRDYSIKGRVKELGPHHFHWTADEVHKRAVHSIEAPTVSTDNLEFWHEFTRKCNQQYLTAEPATPQSSSQTVAPTPRSAPEPVKPKVPNLQSPSESRLVQPNGLFPILDLDQLRDSYKGRKTQDMERILHSANSEDWVTWNFFRIVQTQYPTGWWSHFVAAARRRNPQFTFPFDDRSLPQLMRWSSVPSPPAYEAAGRVRMRNSSNPELVLRANNPEPVEGPSEIDVSFDHDQFLVYVEAKLGSDISMDTKYDPQRNQIVRNVDCLIENAGERMPLFWMLVRDEAPGRAYVQLMKSYKADPSLLARELPHRKRAVLNSVAQNLTILLWSDFSELVCGPGWDAESAAVKQELERRIVLSAAKAV
jgi:hypothetical protein